MRHKRPGEPRRSNRRNRRRIARVDSALERTSFAWWTQVLELARAMARHGHRPPRHHRGPRPSGIAPFGHTTALHIRPGGDNAAINGDIPHHRTRASWSNGLSTRLKQWRAGPHLLRQNRPHLPSRIPPCGHRRVAQTIRKHGPTGLPRVPNGSVSRAVSEVPARPRCPQSLRRATPAAVPHWCSCRRPFGCGDGRKCFDGLDPVA